MAVMVIFSSMAPNLIRGYYSIYCRR